MKFSRPTTSKKAFQVLPERLLLRGGRLIDPGQNLDKKGDLLIENGTISAVGAVDPAGFDGEVLDLKGKVVSPGWIDMHVHLREPGREDQETIESGSLAAANGGFTAVCCMPNTNPAIDSQEIIQYIVDRSRSSLVAVHPIGALTKRREGKELTEMLDLVEQGAVAVSDDHTPVHSAEVMRHALEYARMVNIPVIAFEEDTSMTRNAYMNEGFVSTCLGLRGIPRVAEETMIARDIALAEYTGGHLHVAHISTRKAVELVRAAKAQGVMVTAEVAPHHFTLTDDAVRSFDTNTKVKPPLRTEDDRLALLEGLKDGTIDVIASDHSPFAWEEKSTEFIYAPFGIIGLESSLGLALSALRDTMPLADIIAKFTTNPYRILRLEAPQIAEGQAANLTVFDPEARWQPEADKLLSKCSNTPFLGRTLSGKPELVIHRGKMFKSVL